MNKSCHKPDSTVRTQTDIPAFFAVFSVFILFASYTLLFLGPTQHFSYWAFLDAKPDAALIILSCAILLFSSILLPRKTTPTSLFLWLIFTLIVVPRFVYCSCTSKTLYYPALCLISILLVSTLACAYGASLQLSRSLSRPKGTLPKIIALIALLCILCSIAVLYFKKGAPTFAALSFDGAYEVRSGNEFGSGLSALLTFAGLYASPILICFFSSRSNYLTAILITGCGALLFLWTGNKTWAFIILAAWMLHFATKWKLLTLRNAIAAVTLLFFAQSTCYIFTSYGEGGFIDTIYTLFTRRFIFVPAGLGYEYWDFFQNNPIILLKGTALGFLTPFPIEYQTINYPHRIAFEAMGTSEAYANTGAYGGEFANFSLLGGLLATTANLTLICIVLIRLSSKPAARLFVSQWACLLAVLLLNAPTTKLLFSPTGLCVQFLVIGLAFYSSKIIDNKSEESAYLRS